MSLAMRFPAFSIPMIADAAVQDGDLVVTVSGSPGHVTFPGGASPTSSLFGIVKKPDTVAAVVGATVDVVISGVYPVRAGGTIAERDLITSNGTDGTAKTAAPSAGTNVGVIGTAVETGVSGDRVAVRINAFVAQG